MKTIIITDDKSPGFFYKIEVDPEKDLPFGIDAITQYVDDDDMGLWRIEAFGSLSKHPTEGWEWHETKVVDGVSYGTYRKIEL